MKIPFEINAPKVLTTSAGLAIHDEFLYFIEIDEEINPIRKITVPLSDGCIVNGQIKNFAMLEAGFNELHKQIGKIREPVIIGMPEGEAIIRLPSFPNMSIDDIRGSLDLNFDEYFPFPRQDAVFDILRIKTPADLQERDEVTILAAATKKSTIDKLLDITRKTGIPAGAIEPVNFAMLRSIQEAKEGLCIFADTHNIITVWEGMGIFFRAANNLNGIQDILNTIQFARMQYRNVGIEKIILAGLHFQLSSDSNMTIINVEDEYYSAEGLAMRNNIDTPALDLRPLEFIELEKRRYSFNINRLILWGLIVGFVMLSVGTISYTFTCIRNLSTEIEIMRDSVSDFTRQRMELVQENARLERENQTTEKILQFLQEDIPVLEIMEALEANAGIGLKFDTADFSRNGLTGVTVILDGKADNDKAVMNLTEGLKASNKFSNVMLPVSQRDQTGRIVFKLVLRIGG